MRKAIVTFGVGYDYHQIKPFVTSCTKQVPDANIYIYSGNNTLELRSRFLDFPNVKFIPYQENMVAKVIGKLSMKLPLLAHIYATIITGIYTIRLIDKATASRLAAPLVQFMVKRFFALQQLVEEQPHEQWMFTDLRDVLLQANPFVYVKENNLVTGIEPKRIRECALNSSWLLKTYNKKMYEAIRNQPIACAGVMLGSHEVMQHYLRAITDDSISNLSKIIGMLGADQAIHNKLIYAGLTGVEKQVEKNGEGCIATLHYSSLDEFYLKDGVLKNRYGKEVAVVHQYDRHPALAKEMLSVLENGMQLDLAKAS